MDFGKILHWRFAKSVRLDAKLAILIFFVLTVLIAIISMSPLICVSAAIQLASRALALLRTSVSLVTSLCTSSPTNAAISPVHTVSMLTQSSAASLAVTSSPTLSPATRLTLSSAQPLSNSRMVSVKSAARSKGTTSLPRQTLAQSFVAMESFLITNVTTEISWTEMDARRTASSRKAGVAGRAHRGRLQFADLNQHCRWPWTSWSRHQEETQLICTLHFLYHCVWSTTLHFKPADYNYKTRLGHTFRIPIFWDKFSWP